VNTICHTGDRVLRKIDELREQGYSEVWIEDGDGYLIDEKKFARDS
jgi:hypothetical protein